MTLVDLLNRAILDATDLERMYRLDEEPPAPAKRLTVDDYPGGPAALITSRVPVHPER